MESFHSPIGKKRSLLDRYFSRIHTLKASDAFLLKTALLFCAVFLILFVIQISTGYSIHTPTTGGTFTEGVVGTPRFINPVLAVTRADKDLSALVYDGLMILGTDGVLSPNVAESITVSGDGLSYNVIIKKNIKFHDGDELTAHDVAFTVGRIQDPLVGSALRANFDGVVIKVINDYEVNFILPEPYSPFIENLTFGILPEHVWKDASAEEFPFSQHNSEPIGSGPYAIDNIVRNASGIPVTYILKTNENYHALAPKIDSIELHFFPSDEKLIEAFKKGTIESVVGVDTLMLAELDIHPETHHLERIPLPRTFAVFFNQNKSAALRDSAARKALDSAIDRKALVETVLGGYGNVLTSPIPVGFGLEHKPLGESTTTSIDTARDILRTGGWKFNAENKKWEKTIDGTLVPLSFSIATVNNSAFEKTAEYLRNTWEQLGVEVNIKQFEQSDLTQSIIRPRDYEALLFGTQLGRSLDYYSFWHSSQRNDPGLNIALYANITTDSILSEMRRTTTSDGRTESLNRFADEILKETPALFLYSPELLYVFPNKVTGATFTGVSEPYERWSSVSHWYIKTESVWPFFTK